MFIHMYVYAYMFLHITAQSELKDFKLFFCNVQII